MQHREFIAIANFILLSLMLGFSPVQHNYNLQTVMISERRVERQQGVVLYYIRQKVYTRDLQNLN